MQIADYIAHLTGMSLAELFAGPAPLVCLEQEIDGDITIAYWDESLPTVQPSAEDIAAAIEAAPPAGPPAAVESVSARQFKLQLLAEDLLDAVDAWVATQDRATQIAYEYSGTFVKGSPMMVAGFAAMGFDAGQVDAFFAAAAAL